MESLKEQFEGKDSHEGYIKECDDKMFFAAFDLKIMQ